MALLVRYLDPDNFMGVELRDNGTVNLIKMLDGKQFTVASGSYSGSSPYTTYVRCTGTSYVVRVEGSQVISTTDSDISHGAVGLWVERVGKFEAVKAGDDSGADGDLDDGADTLVIHDTFTGTSKSPVLTPFRYSHGINSSRLRVRRRYGGRIFEVNRSIGCPDASFGASGSPFCATDGP